MNALVSRQAALQERFAELDGAYYRSRARSALAGLGFSEEECSMPLNKLSGGQKTRVALGKILLSDANLLLLDEPTNHLDIASREALEAALSGYDGTMLMVSHDRYFINRLADRILYLTPDGVTEHAGNYDELLAGRRETAPVRETEVQTEEKVLACKERRQLEAQKRKTLNRCAKAEELIAELEGRIKELAQASEAPEAASDYVKLSELSSRTASLQQELDGYLEEWEALQRVIDENGYDA